MSILKNTAALSLAVLISFAVTGCEGSFTISGGSPTQSASASESQASSSEEETEKVRAQAEVTLNEIKELAESDELKAFYDEMSGLDEKDPDFIKNLENIIDKNKPLQDKIEEKIELTPEALRGYQGIYAMSTSDLDIDFPEKVINASISYSAMFDIVEKSKFVEPISRMGITSNAVTEKDGKYELNTYGIFSKGVNGAILGFPETSFNTLGLEDGGKKLVIEEVDGDTREDRESVSSDEQLGRDVKNAAVTIESWIVNQGGKDVPLIVEDGRIVSGVPGSRGEPEFKISDGVKLDFEGDSYEYVITGTSEETGAVVTYDSARGGMQETSPGVEKVDKDSVEYDYSAFKKFEKVAVNGNYKNLNEYVDYLNSDKYGSDAKFEVVTKDGTDYVKVTDSNSKITEDELLYVSPLS